MAAVEIVLLAPKDATLWTGGAVPG